MVVQLNNVDLPAMDFNQQRTVKNVTRHGILRLISFQKTRPFNIKVSYNQFKEDNSLISTLYHYTRRRCKCTEQNFKLDDDRTTTLINLLDHGKTSRDRGGLRERVIKT